MRLFSQTLKLQPKYQWTKRDILLKADRLECSFHELIHLYLEIDLFVWLMLQDEDHLLWSSLISDDDDDHPGAPALLFLHFIHNMIQSSQYTVHSAY